MTHIIQLAIPRSGSTVIYQVLRHVFPTENIVKTHHFSAGSKISTVMYLFLRNLSQKSDFANAMIKNDTKFILTCRDFRDIVVSQWKISQSLISTQKYKKVNTPKTRDEETLRLIVSFMNESDVIRWATEVRKQISLLDVCSEIDREKVLWLKYELFFNDFEYIFEKFSAFFNIEISGSLRLQIKENCNIEKNEMIASRMKDFSEYDSASQIHGHHIHNGSIGGWRQCVKPEHQEILLDILGDKLQQYGYEI